MSQTKAQLLDGKSSSIQFSTGSASSPTVSFTGDTNTGIYSPGADQVAVSTGGTGRLFVDSSGRVGLGTSSASTRLHVRSATDDATPIIRAQSNNATQHVDLGFYYINYDNGATSAPLEFQIDGSTKMALSSTGLGIGTTSPSSQLEVSTSSGDTRLTVQGGTNGDGILALAGAGTGIAKIAFWDQLAFGKSSAGAGDIATENARIDSSGRLLVGTSSARSNYFNSSSFNGPLNIEVTGGNSNRVASFIANSNDSNSPIFVLGKSRSATVGGNTAVNSGDEIGILSFQAADGSELVEAARIQCNSDGTPGANAMPARLVFYTTADGASGPTERMRITNSGTVLVGRTANTTIVSNAALQPSNLAVEVGGDVTGAWWNRTDSNAAWVAQRFYAQGSLSGFIQVNTSSVTYSTTSDYRLKENVVPLTGAANRVNQLQVHRFNFIAEPDKTVDGFLAHEAQEVVPECVTGTKDAVDDDGNPVYQGIDQSKLVPLLTAALQEALQKIETLEQRLNDAGIA